MVIQGKSAFAEATDARPAGRLGTQLISNMRYLTVPRVEVERVVADVASATGFDFGSFLPKRMTPSEVFTRTVQLHRGFSEDERFDSVGRAAGKAEYTYNRRDRAMTDQTGRKATGWKVSGAVRFEPDPNGGQGAGYADTSGLPTDPAARFNAAFMFYDTHMLTDDVSVFLKAAVEDMAAVTLRLSGGVYFVMACYQKRLDALVQVIRGVAGKAALALINMDEDAAGEHAEAVRNGAEAAFQAALAESKSLLEQFEEGFREMARDTSGKKRGPRLSLAPERWAEVMKTVEQLELYSDMLNYRFDDVRATALKLRKEWGAWAGMPSESAIVIPGEATAPIPANVVPITSAPPAPAPKPTGSVFDDL